jgi:D-sedoheptulose 7-phosphate isomerase
VDLVRHTLAEGGKLLVFGNGGSAADAQHLAAELVWRYRAERRGLPALALTTDSSVLTAVANDRSFDHVFAQQIAALGRPGDLAVAISTSGRSANAVAGVRAARAGGLKVLALSGHDAGELAPLADVCLTVPCSVTARIQEGHGLLIHLLCELLDRRSEP